MAVSRPAFSEAVVGSCVEVACACPHGGAAILRRGWESSGQGGTTKTNKAQINWGQGLALWDEGFREGQVPRPRARAVCGQSSWRGKGPRVCFHVL